MGKVAVLKEKETGVDLGIVVKAVLVDTDIVERVAQKDMGTEAKVVRSQDSDIEASESAIALKEMDTVAVAKVRDIEKMASQSHQKLEIGV